MRRFSPWISSLALTFCALSFFSLFGDGLGWALPRVAPPIPLPFHALHLRCNGTDWQLSPASLMHVGRDASELELTLDVKEPWMLKVGDSCLLTETVEPMKWGSWQRTYTLNPQRLKAPSSATLAVDQTLTPHPFRVIFPKLGRYRAVYKIAEASLSIITEGPQRAGDVVWTWPGTASLDAAARLFVELREPAPSLIRLEPASGRALWKYRAKEQLSFNPDCNDSQHAYVLERGALSAVGSETGLARWYYDLRGERPDSTALLSCPAGSPLIFLIHGDQNAEVTALERTSGKVRWTYRGTHFLNVQGSEDGVLYLSSFQDGISRIVGLDRQSGAALWTRYLNSSWFNFDPQGALYVLEGTRLSRLHARTGRELWTYQSTADWLYLSFEQGRTLITEKDRVARLDPQSGSEIWSQRLATFYAEPAFASVLKSGEVLIRTSDTATQRERSLILDGASGAVLWESEGAEAQSFVSLAPDMESYRIEGAAIASLNIRTGDTSWTYRYPTSDLGQAPQIVNVRPEGALLAVSFSRSARPQPEMGVLALDRATGQMLWQNFQEEPLTLEGQAEGLLIINVGTQSGVAKALKF